MSDVSQPTVRFYRLIEAAPAPCRADRSALGTLPTRAFRYCEAVTTAAAFGWYVFAPMELRLIWDGTDIFWHYQGAADWLPLQPAAQFPGQSARFDAAAPPELRGCSPPLLTALPEPGAVQIWTGLFARTAPGWSLLMRAPANLPGNGGCSHYEGIVETDTWFGPVFANLRLTRTGVPVRLAPELPLLQLQPLPRAAYAEETLGAASSVPLDSLDAEDWQDYAASIADPARPPAAYAIAARRRRKAGGCPFSRTA